MTVAIILIVFICSFIIVHNINKIKDELNDIKEKINEIYRYQTRYYEHFYNLLYQIDSCVEDIEDKRIKFICETNDKVIELYDTELLNIKPTIDKNGNAILIINYYDIEFCVNSTMFCNKVEIVNSEMESNIISRD